MLKYAITDPKYYRDLGVNLAEFTRLKTADFILLRDKSNPNYADLAKIFLSFRAEFKAKLILHDDLNSALNLGADGVHFSSANLDKLRDAPSNLLKFASTHDDEQIRKSYDLGADFITFSPVFATPNKGDGVGLKALKRAVLLSSVPVFGLGGIISDEQIAQISSSGAIGFASIRYFAN